MPPVATYVDDTPLYVNLRLDDLDHVEILRGPQGTLYGSGSLGGTIRFVQNAPDPDAFDAKFSVGTSDTDHTHRANGELSGMINIPLSSTLAIRANASYTNEAGFIDQPHLYALDAAGAPIAQNPADPFSPAVTGSAKGPMGTPIARPVCRRCGSQPTPSRRSCPITTSTPLPAAFHTPRRNTA